MNNKISKEKVINIVLMMVIVTMAFVLSITLVQNENMENKPTIVSEPKVIKGDYTLIHYPNGGWTNAIYITEYYIDGQILWFKEKDSKEFKPVWLSQVLTVDGWIEGKELTDYGYWISELDID